MKTYWNGEELDPPARQATAVIADSGRFPSYWARSADLVGVRVSVVEVLYFDEPMYLFDGDGSGWAKVTEGSGSPRWGHRDVEIEEGSVEYK